VAGACGTVEARLAEDSSLMEAASELQAATEDIRRRLRGRGLKRADSEPVDDGPATVRLDGVASEDARSVGCERLALEALTGLNLPGALRDPGLSGPGCTTCDGSGDRAHDASVQRTGGAAPAPDQQRDVRASPSQSRAVAQAGPAPPLGRRAGFASPRDRGGPATSRSGAGTSVARRRVAAACRKILRNGHFRERDTRVRRTPVLISQGASAAPCGSFRAGPGPVRCRRDRST